MFIILLFRMALNVDMDVKAVHTAKVVDSSPSKINDIKLTEIIKSEPNMHEEETHVILKKIDEEMPMHTEASLITAQIKTENYTEHDKPLRMVVINTEMDCKAIDSKDTVNQTNFQPRDLNYAGAVIKSEPNLTIENEMEKLHRTSLVSLSEKELSHRHDIPNKPIMKMWHTLWDEPVDVPSGLSKRQKKKYIKKVLWETKWKPLRRAKEKEKLKQKKIQARINNETLGPSRKMLKHATMARSKCKLRIVLDFSFDDLMSEKDLGKCLKQLNHCYCLNRRAPNPLQFYVTNFCGSARDQLQRGIAYKNWDINFHEDNYLNIFKKEELVYLTSDSDNTLTQLDQSKVYIIGALVDHNTYKGKTLEIAEEQGISHAKLPISEFIQMDTRKVLTIDHVFEILVHASGGVSWKDSFLKVLPLRKRAVEKITS